MKKAYRVVGKIVVPGDANVWSHEMATARALATIGHNVEFIRKSTRNGEHSADALIDGVKWEMKAPRSSKLSSIEDNLKKALRQSDKIVFDSRRMKRLPDNAILRELTSQLRRSKAISKILFISRNGKVVDVTTKV